MVGAQQDLLTWVPPPTDRDGATYSRAQDFVRLNNQQQRVWESMRDGKARTLREISDLTGDPEASVSARLRDFNKPHMSSYLIRMNRQRRGDSGTWEYWLNIARKP